MRDIGTLWASKLASRGQTAMIFLAGWPQACEVESRDWLSIEKVEESTV